MQILIVGASRGIGLEFVRQYRADGAQVHASARDDAGLDRLTALGAQAFKLDVTDAASAAGLAARIAGAALDLVIVNAGVYGPRTEGLELPSGADFDAVMHTNLLGPMRLLPQLQNALATRAKIAVISSQMGSIGSRADTAGWLYRASKAALNSVLKDAAIALRGKAVCVALHPGWVRTDMGGAGADLPVEQSVADMRRLLAGLSAVDSGRFLNHDGAPIDW